MKLIHKIVIFNKKRNPQCKTRNSRNFENMETETNKQKTIGWNSVDKKFLLIYVTVHLNIELI